MKNLLFAAVFFCFVYVVFIPAGLLVMRVDNYKQNSSAEKAECRDLLEKIMNEISSRPEFFSNVSVKIDAEDSVKFQDLNSWKECSFLKIKVTVKNTVYEISADNPAKVWGGVNSFYSGKYIISGNADGMYNGNFCYLSKKEQKEITIKIIRQMYADLRKL